MPNGCTQIDILKPQARSRVGTGKTLFLERVDSRSIAARRFKEVFRQIIADIGGDPTEAQTQIARRATALAIWCESVEAQLVGGAQLDIGQFTTAANSLRRLLSDLGLERKARNVTPSLNEYLASKRADPLQSMMDRCLFQLQQRSAPARIQLRS